MIMPGWTNCARPGRHSCSSSCIYVCKHLLQELLRSRISRLLRTLLLLPLPFLLLPCSLVGFLLF